MIYTCPICGNPNLTRRPYNDDDTSASDEICPCCGFQFGYDDHASGRTHAAWRRHWIDSEMPWFSRGRRPPPGWDPAAQLAAQIATENQEAFEHRPAHPHREIPASPTFPSYSDRLPEPRTGDEPDLPVQPHTAPAELDPIRQFHAAAWEGSPEQHDSHHAAVAYYRKRIARPVGWITDTIAQLVTTFAEQLPRTDPDAAITVSKNAPDTDSPAQFTVHIAPAGPHAGSEGAWTWHIAVSFAAIHISGDDRATSLIAATFVRAAQNLGLVCFDPGTGRILPLPK
jgi:hypothetical protein